MPDEQCKEVTNQHPLRVDENSSDKKMRSWFCVMGKMCSFYFSP